MPEDAISRFWAAFCAACGIPGDTPYEAWAFGGDPDGLAALVLSGDKRATASAYPLYALENEPLPQAGNYSVLLDGAERPLCVIRNTAVRVIPFDRVTAEHAFLEGEGDKSLAYWRAVHEAFFTKELTQAGLVFDSAMPVVCERFEVVYTG